MGAEEGIYTLNLTELHENAMDLLYPRRTVWMFVIKDVLMTLSGTKAYSTQHLPFVEKPLHYTLLHDGGTKVKIKVFKFLSNMHFFILIEGLH